MLFTAALARADLQSGPAVLSLSADGQITLSAEEHGELFQGQLFLLVEGEKELFRPNAERGEVRRMETDEGVIVTVMVDESARRPTRSGFLISPDSLPEDARLYLEGTGSWPEDVHFVRADAEAEDSSIAQMSTGDGSHSRRVNAAFFPQIDLLVEILGEETRFSGEGVAATVGEQIRLSVYPHYYENNTSVGSGHYQPLDRSVFKDPPTGWNSWYIYFAAIDENNIHSNIDWLGENLRQFGLTYAVLDDGWQTASRGFFQYANSAYKNRDRERMNELAKEPGSWAEWNEKFPSGGKAVADYIKSRGLKPGLWLCPFATDENELTEQHPEWWVRDEEGWIVPTFKARYTIDASNPEVIEQWLKPTIRRMVDDWGFEYLKMDGMTHVTNAYKDHEERLYANRKEDVPEMDWVDAYRLGHKAIREAAGDDTFTLSCWGTAWQGVGLTDSSRTGTDAGVGHEDSLKVERFIRGAFYATNMVWYTDPDVVCVRDPMTLDQARFRAAITSLTGQATILSDDMPALQEERVEVLRRILPTLFVRPLDLYKLGDNQTDIVDVRIEKPFGAWNVIGMFQGEEEAAERTVSIESLGLPTDTAYVGYDFWEKQFIPPFEGEQTFSLQPTSCKIIALHPVLDRPQVVSTSRHITQGGVELQELAWDASTKTLSGVSEIVANDPYEIRLHVPEAYQLQEAQTTEGATAEIGQTGEFSTVTISSPESRGVRWQLKF